MSRGAALLLALHLAAPALAAAQSDVTAVGDGADAAATASVAAEPSAEIAAAEAKLEATAPALSAALATPTALAPLADAVWAYERALGALRTAVDAADVREQTLSLALASQRDAISRLLASFEAVSRLGVSASGLHPEGPIGARRAEVMMARLGPALDAEAGALRARYAELTVARDVLVNGSTQLAVRSTALETAQAELAARMAALAPEPAIPSPELVALARESENLGALAIALGKTSVPPPPAEALPAGPMLWPVAGQVTRRFEERDAAGVRQPGVQLSAPPLAVVRAPVDAVVRYAGPFLEYGYVLVLAPSPDETVLLAGLARVQPQVGALVKRGDLVGLLGGRSLDVEETVSSASQAGTVQDETLYIEVRNSRGPVDPEPLFAGEDG